MKSKVEYYVTTYDTIPRIRTQDFPKKSVKVLRVDCARVKKY